MNTKPKIMLAMPADVEIYRLVERNLAHYGFEVIYLNFAQQRGTSSVIPRYGRG